MNKFFCTQVTALSLLCFALGSAAAASPTIYLSCRVNGVSTFGEKIEDISETVEVEVEEKPWLTIVLRGPTIAQFLSSEDLDDSGLTSTALHNRSRRDVWDLSTKTVNPGKRTYVSTLKINRVNGSFSYSREGATTSGISFDERVAGACVKRSAVRQF